MKRRRGVRRRQRPAFVGCHKLLRLIQFSLQPPPFVLTLHLALLSDFLPSCLRRVSAGAWLIEGKLDFRTSAADAANGPGVGAEGRLGVQNRKKIRWVRTEVDVCLCYCRFQRLGPQGAAAGRLRGAAQHGPEEGAAQASRLRTHT